MSVKYRAKSTDSRVLAPSKLNFRKHIQIHTHLLLNTLFGIFQRLQFCFCFSFFCVFVFISMRWCYTQCWHSPFTRMMKRKTWINFYEEIFQAHSVCDMGTCVVFLKSDELFSKCLKWMCVCAKIIAIQVNVLSWMHSRPSGKKRKKENKLPFLRIMCSNRGDWVAPTNLITVYHVIVLCAIHCEYSFRLWWQLCVCIYVFVSECAFSMLVLFFLVTWIN